MKHNEQVSVVLHLIVRLSFVEPRLKWEVHIPNESLLWSEFEPGFLRS